MRNSNDKRYGNFVKGLKKTGFGLEYSISELLKNAGWYVINNKYYIDDVQETAREIDIIAYKSSLESEVRVYTVLVISCKKSDDRTWCLLAKDKNEQDPNIDWSPVTLWSNNNILKFMIENYDWKSNYLKLSKNIKEKLLEPEKHIFAFQELNSEKGTPQNDKAIFNSVISTMKSQDYELRSLDQRKKEESLYNFNLVSIIDAPLIRALYKDKTPEIEELRSDLYVGSYIVNKKESAARVHFIQADHFSSFLPAYEKLHLHNVNQRIFIEEQFFRDCVKDPKKAELLEEEFSNGIYWEAALELEEHGIELGNILNFKLEWDAEEKRLELRVIDIHDSNTISLLNQDKKFRKIVASYLRKTYRYVGDYRFVTDIPF